MNVYCVPLVECILCSTSHGHRIYSQAGLITGTVYGAVNPMADCVILLVSVSWFDDFPVPVLPPEWGISIRQELGKWKLLSEVHLVPAILKSLSCHLLSNKFLLKLGRTVCL